MATRPTDDSQRCAAIQISIVTVSAARLTKTGVSVDEGTIQRRSSSSETGTSSAAKFVPQLGRCDRAVLGAVEAERPAAQHPGEKRDDRDGEGLGPVGAGDESEGQRCEQRGEEHEALAQARGPSTAQQRRERHGELREAAEKRQPHDERRRVRHAPRRERGAVGAAEAPDALADDRNAVGPRQPAQPGKCRRGICLGQDCENRGVVHLGTIAALGPFGKSRTAHSACRTGLPVTAADEAEECKHHDDDQNDPEDAHSAPSVGPTCVTGVREGNGRVCPLVTTKRPPIRAVARPTRSRAEHLAVREAVVAVAGVRSDVLEMRSCEREPLPAAAGASIMGLTCSSMRRSACPRFTSPAASTCALSAFSALSRPRSF